MDELHLATLNLRNLADRWSERDDQARQLIDGLGAGPAADAQVVMGDPACLDCIWPRGDVRVASARLAFDRPDPPDPTLFPSDHLGISARLEVGRTDRPQAR